MLQQKLISKQMAIINDNAYTENLTIKVMIVNKKNFKIKNK